LNSFEYAYFLAVSQQLLVEERLGLNPPEINFISSYFGERGLSYRKLNIPLSELVSNGQILSSEAQKAEFFNKIKARSVISV
jgi:hypothetical protein